MSDKPSRYSMNLSIEIDKAAEVVSESQLYQQAGNSIVVDVLVNLYLSFLAPETKTRQATIDSWGE